jgi:hypothetical protein
MPWTNFFNCCSDGGAGGGCCIGGAAGARCTFGSTCEGMEESQISVFNVMSSDSHHPLRVKGRIVGPPQVVMIRAGGHGVDEACEEKTGLLVFGFIASAPWTQRLDSLMSQVTTNIRFTKQVVRVTEGGTRYLRLGLGHDLSPKQEQMFRQGSLSGLHFRDNLL